MGHMKYFLLSSYKQVAFKDLQVFSSELSNKEIVEDAFAGPEASNVLFRNDFHNSYVVRRKRLETVLP